jgi:hypothetical protein
VRARGSSQIRPNKSPDHVGGRGLTRNLAKRVAVNYFAAGDSANPILAAWRLR